VDEGFAALKAFQTREGHCRVPHRHIEGEFKLGAWVNNLNRYTENMPAERRQRLGAIGLVLVKRNEVEPRAWERGFAALVEFKAREGHCNVPFSHTEGNFALGRWVNKQRAKRKTPRPERRQQLEEIGFVWNRLEDRWEEGFAALKTFKAREGHCLVPKAHMEGAYNLGSWVMN